MKKRLRIKLAKRRARYSLALRKDRDDLDIADTPGFVRENVIDLTRAGSEPSSDRAEIYMNELEYVLRCILERPDIETGGELFGFWKDDGTPVVTYAIGPGPKANHEYAFFNQDMDYLSCVGAVLTRKFGLEHIGEWHSHHQLGLVRPSRHDAATIAHGMVAHRRKRFLLCIGTCPAHSVRLGGFAFRQESGEVFSHVKWHVFGVESPYRRALDGDPELVDILIHPMTIEDIRHGKTAL